MLSLIGLLWATAGLGQTPLVWTTNYYSITGHTLPELRQSIRQARPWKDRLDMDGYTEWRVSWHFSVTPTADGCQCSSFITQGTVVITLPRWIVPTNAPATTVGIWTNYFAALRSHEVGHGQMAVAAAAELNRRAREQSSGADCESLRRALKQLGETVLAEYRQRDKDYDARTRHGATQGAILPGRERRGR